MAGVNMEGMSVEEMLEVQRALDEKLRAVAGSSESRRRRSEPGRNSDGGFIRCDSDNSESSDDNLSPNAASVDGLEVTVRLLGTGVDLPFCVPSTTSVERLQQELTALGECCADADLWMQKGKLQPQELLQDGAQLFLPSQEDLLLLSMFPEHIRCKINPSTLVDVALDLGRPPLLHERDAKGSMRRREVSSAVLTQAELDAIAGHELLEGRWSSDDRSGVSGTLHRVCRNIDSLDSSVVGITIRMARPMYHMTRHIQELQEILRNKNSFAKVCHPSVGRWTRRKLVAKRERQHQDMLETVQNHTPEVLVIDEIGSREEVEAASSIGFRGVALVATAHARSLKDAMDNPTLQPLFGGFADSTVSDETMRRTGRGKNLRERKGEPVFKSLVELSDVGDQWRIYPSVADAVDATLANNPPRSVLADASFQGRSRPSRKAFFTATTETSSRGDVDAVGAEAKRRTETSGRAYRLCFDGGVHSTGRPGGAGALLRRLRARTGKAIKRPAAEWMLCTQQPTSAPQMEYAALLIGLRGTLDILHRLQPKPLSIFIEGDCRFVVDRHQGSQPVPIQHEHPEVARTLQQFTVLVDEAVESLREQGVEVGCLWRRRGRNRAAGRLAQEARRRRRDDIEERCFSQDERQLLLFEPHLIPTRWHIQEVHPCLRLERVSQGAGGASLAAEQCRDGLEADTLQRGWVLQLHGASGRVGFFFPSWHYAFLSAVLQ
ncbi:unnamed protein product [Effrenium voratum]|uniref:Uncharacterized protein n=1 Tax=Effrenium voratum TaxID=2562239 RepID=A0AA36NHW2_9DINO|nr:unnamed protein product [Effrenium voratum]